MAAGEPFVIMDSLTQRQELFVTCSDMDTSDGLLVTGMVEGAVLFGWTTFCAMEPKTALENVDTVAGRDMTVHTGNKFQFYASHLQRNWLAVPVHEKDVLKCNITASGEPCVMILSTTQQQVWFATCSGTDALDGTLVTATVTGVDRFG